MKWNEVESRKANIHIRVQSSLKKQNYILMKNNIMVTIGIILLFSHGLYAQKSGTKLTDYVNPFIGSGAMKGNLPGNNYPGPTTPFGFIQLSPDTKDEIRANTACGYNYGDKTIVGFSHTHLNGTGVSDLFDVLMLPTIGDIKTIPGNADSVGSGYRSRFSHDKESARVGYYQVNLLDYNINAELTATEHVGFHRYTFPQSNQSHILIDLNHSLDKERKHGVCRIILAEVKLVDNKTIEGYRIITGWAHLRKVYFRAEFSKPFSGNVMISGNSRFENLNAVIGTSVKAVFNFDTKDGEKILVKVALSPVSIENARLNLKTEVPDWDFDQVARETENKWEKELQKVSVDGTKEQKEVFYTALYHAFVQPNNIADVNGDYQAPDMAVRSAPDKTNYSTFSLWDTFRAAHPLYTILQTERSASFINSMFRQYDTYGFLPVWQLWGDENYCMIGNHAIPVIVDAVLKGIKGFDVEKAYEAVKASSLTDHSKFPATVLDKYGYIPEEIHSQSVSIALEVGYDDWCVAQLAKKLGKMNDYEYFMRRSAFYKNFFDPKTNFFRAKDKNGNWLEPFDPMQYGGNGGNPYTEGNAWQYLWYVPQDVNGLVTLMGGKNAFIAKLDTFFTLPLKNSAAGHIGQYAHGNEPSHHIIYLYNFVEQPWKTQKYAAYILNEFYNNTSSGYVGNEDCGQMASWYIFSSMGFYPVNPANGVYVIGSPVLKSAEIHLEGGKTFTSSVKNPSKANIYVQSVKLNGKEYTKSYITHDDIIRGGTLEFIMGDKPNKKWGIGKGNTPPDSSY